MDGRGSNCTFSRARMGTFAKAFLAVSVGILCGGLSFWAVFVDEGHEIDRLAEDALCVLELQAGTPESSASFTTSRTVERFYVGARPGARGERLWLTVSGNGAFSFNGPVTRPTRFTCGRDIPPGTYRVALRQETGSSGGLVVIAGKEPPVRVTGWQILSRTFLALLTVSGIWALAVRKSKNPKRSLSLAR